METSEATATALPKFRSDLELVSIDKRGKSAGWILRDPRTDWVFELTSRDYFVCRHLDGRTTLEELRAGFEERFGDRFPQRQFDHFIEQLRDSGFLDEDAELSEEQIAEVYGRDSHNYTRIQLANPDRFFTWAEPYVRWWFTRTFFWMTVPFLAFAAWLVLRDWWTYADAFDKIWNPFDFVKLILVGLFFVMIPRELVHGLACKHYGGTVPATGILITRVLPKVYVDITAIRWLPKNKRMHVIFAHGWAIWVLWTIGTIGWWLSTPGTATYDFWMLLSATSGWSALWAWNPKLPKDAYNLLITWLGTPRLRGRALRIVTTYLIFWKSSEPFTRQELRWFLFFGVGAWIYNIAHITILWGAAGRFLIDQLQGWGMTIAVVFLAMWSPVRVKKAFKRAMRVVFATDARVSIKMAVRIGLAVIVLIILFIPYPYDTGGTFTILPIQNTEVHCEIDGGPIIEVPVKEGQWVNKGDVLGRIDPREYQKNLDTSKAQLDTTVAQLALLRKQFALLVNPPNIEQINALEAEVRRLTAVVENARRELDLTVLRAPLTGRVITPYVDQKVGQYLKKSDLFATVEDSRTVQVEILVYEGDISEVKVGAKVKAAPWAYSSRSFPGQVLSVGTVGNLDPTKTTVVRTLAQLTNVDYLLKSQMTGYAKIDTRYLPIWDVLLRRMIRWIKVEVWFWIP